MSEILKAMKATKYPADVFVGKNTTVADVIALTEQLQQENKAWQAKNDALVVRESVLINQIKKVVSDIDSLAYINHSAKDVVELLNYKDLKAMLNETESESLAKMRAEAVGPIAKTIHYPECWDTMAYPTLLDAISEMAHCNDCQQGKDHD